MIQQLHPSVQYTHHTSVVHTFAFSLNANTLHSAAFLPCHRSAASLSERENSKFAPPCFFVTACTPLATCDIASSDLAESA